MSVTAKPRLRCHVLFSLPSYITPIILRIIRLWRYRRGPPPMGEVLDETLCSDDNISQHKGQPVGTFVEALVRGAADLLWRPVLVMPHGEDTPGVEHRDGVEIRRFHSHGRAGLKPMLRGGMAAAMLARPGLKVLLPGFFASYWRAAMSAARGCDIIHCHWTVSGLVGAMVRPFRKIPLVVTTHGSDIALGEESASLRRLNRFVAHRADSMVIVGSHQRNTCCRLAAQQRR